jgi:hypothetical protein
MLAALSGDPRDSFTYFCFWAQFDTESPYSRRALDLDVAGLPGWEMLRPEERELVLSSAAAHLDRVDVDLWTSLGTDTYQRAAIDAARAIILLIASGNAEMSTRFMAPRHLR